MKRIGRASVFLICLSMVLGIFGVRESYSKFYSFATGNTGGVWYIVGAQFASHANKRVKDMVVTAEITGGALENYNLIKRGKVDFALTNPDLVYLDAKEKVQGGITKKQVNQVLWSYNLSQLAWFVKKDSDIKNVLDFKGKRVCNGSPATTTLINNINVIKHLTGYEPDKDYKAFNYNPNEAKSAFLDGLIDVGLSPGGYPAPIIVDLARVRDIRLVSLTKEQVDSVLRKYPAFIEVVIPAGTYKGIDEPVRTIAWSSGIICRPEVPEKDVYQFIKALFTDVKERDAAHPQAKTYTIDATLDFGEKVSASGIPFHPGVVKYLKEIGKWNPKLETK